MFSKKIESKELLELKKRMELINSYKLVFEALTMQKNLYLNSILPKYGCDMNKSYNINFDNGKITETKQPMK